MMAATAGLDLQEYDLICRARDGGEALYALAALIGRIYVGDGAGERQLLAGLASTLRILGSAELQLAHEWDDLRRLRGRAEPAPSGEGGDA
jgi:hypothetical protein